MTNTTTPAAWGVDGCEAGWFYFKLLGSADPEYDRVDTLAEVVDLANARDLILVDIPIGLPTGTGGYDYRECDRLARGVLKKKDDVEMKGKRASSVFSAPVRAVLGAADYEDAQKRSLAATGNRSISKQAWAITPKIAEADLLLQSCEKAKRIVRETHPEVCFQFLAGHEQMQFDKKHGVGFLDRVKVLEKCRPRAKKAIVKACRKHLDVGSDDIVDAMACAVTAFLAMDRLRSLPDGAAVPIGAPFDPLRSEPMIVYSEPPSRPRA